MVRLPFSFIIINKHYTKVVILLLILIFSFSIFHRSGLLKSNLRDHYFDLKPASITRDNRKLRILLESQNELLSQKFTDDKVISDMRINQCKEFPLFWKVLCNKKVPQDYIQLQPQLNYNIVQSQVSHNLFDSMVTLIVSFVLPVTHYFVIVKFDPIDQTDRIITDLSLSKNDESYELIKSHNGQEIETHDGSLDYKIYMKILSLDSQGIKVSELPPQTQILRNIDILFGTIDFQDLRPNRKSLHLKLEPQTLHPVLSFDLTSPLDHESFLRLKEQTTLIKQKQTIRSENKFKILQLSDLHFGLEEQNENSMKSSDSKTSKFIEDAIQIENPDLVILNGDLFDIHRVFDLKSIILKILQPILLTNKYFLFTFGDELGEENNEEMAKSKHSILEFLMTIPNCLNYREDSSNTLHGVTNNNFKIQFEKSSSRIFIFDSENRFIDNSQINYLYRHNHNDEELKLLFFHNPIPQFRPVGKFKIIGSYNEKHPLNSKIHQKFHDDLINCNINVLSVGHEHENDACILSQNSKGSIWLCYNGVTGESGITRIDQEFARRLRLFEIDFDQKRLLSWKRNQKDMQVFDYQLIHQVK